MGGGKLQRHTYHTLTRPLRGQGSMQGVQGRRKQLPPPPVTHTSAAHMCCFPMCPECLLGAVGRL
jgi:hypothetical protein